MKREMQKITVEVVEPTKSSLASGGGKVKIVMRGDQQVEGVEIDGEERGDLKKAFNKAVKESQKKVAQKLSGMVSGMKFPNL